MKQLAIIILITTLHTSLGAQTECYHTLPPYKVANASAVAQYFTACQTGSAIQIRTYLAVYPFINDAILFSVYNAQGVLIGTTNYYGDVMIYNYDTPQPLPPASVTVECQVVAGQVYRWEISQCCQTDGGNGLPIYVVVEETATDQLQGNTVYYFTSPQGQQQNSFTIPKDLHAAVLVYKYYNPCPGDCNGNGVLDIEDAMCLIDEVGNTYSTGSVVCDMDGDCDVDEQDIQLFKNQFGQPCQQ